MDAVVNIPEWVKVLRQSIDLNVDFAAPKISIPVPGKMTSRNVSLRIDAGHLRVCTQAGNADSSSRDAADHQFILNSENLAIQFVGSASPWATLSAASTSPHIVPLLDRCDTSTLLQLTCREQDTISICASMTVLLLRKELQCCDYASMRQKVQSKQMHAVVATTVMPLQPSMASACSKFSLQVPVVSTHVSPWRIQQLHHLVNAVCSSAHCPARPMRPARVLDFGRLERVHERDHGAAVGVWQSRFVALQNGRLHVMQVRVHLCPKIRAGVGMHVVCAAAQHRLEVLYFYM